MLATLLLDMVYPALKGLAASIGLPWWLDGVLIDGAYRGMAWVVAVMLPPMAIFFPLFTLLEDFGNVGRQPHHHQRGYGQIRATASQRIYHTGDGWWISTREKAELGPFDSEKDASMELCLYIRKLNMFDSQIAS